MIFINSKPVNGPWGGGNLWTQAMHKYLPIANNHQLIFGPCRPTVALISQLYGDSSFGAWDIINYKQYRNPKVKIAIRVNENDARKATDYVDETLIGLSKFVDKTVFVSEWISDYFMSKGWVCKNNAVIYNGVERQHFKPNPKFSNGKINIVAHHWSNNHLKGFDIYDKLDEFVSNNHDFTFTYIGRDRGTFKSTKVIAPLFGQALGDELGRYDVYVSASRWDPGPNHVIEAVSCKLPTYVHEDGGGAVEFANGTNVYSTFDELKSILLSKKYDINDDKFGSWEDCVMQYEEFLCRN